MISFDALLGSGGGVVGQTALGWVARRFSLSVGYMLGGAILALATPVYAALGRLRDEHDPIRDTKREPDDNESSRVES